MEFPPPCRDGNDSITSSALSPMGVKLPRIRELGTQLSEEAERLQAASVEFSYLQRVR
ncbi:unnamed protein product [Brassica rapa]|nr:unnamed protein product [Brassica rapa]VDC59329.1 unnamed protein product [Brassica rapa]VDC66132.1 unnamed protein product [Brassica rapa]